MNKTLWQKFTPHIIAIALFFVVTCVYCLPVFKGQALNGHDSAGWKAMSHQSFEFKEKYGHFPLWTNSMLSGMPTYQIAMDSKYNITLAYLYGILSLYLPPPASYFFLACLSFYILCLVVGARNWIGVLGAIGYAFASYDAVIASVGHMSKFGSMALAPGVLAGFILLTQRKYVLGFIVTLIWTTCLFYQNHIQVVYYTFLIAGFLGLAYLINVMRTKEALKPVAISLGTAIVALGLSAASYAIMLIPSQAYVKETMRGGRSELTPLDKNNKSTGGLDKDYAFNWSYGMAETFTFVVPRIYGGSGPSVVNNQYVSEIGKGSKTAAIFAERTGMPEDQADEFAQQFSPYWGPQGSTSGTVYLGAIICFLFIVGLVFYRGWHLWWILAATVFGILLAWGKNFAALNYFLFDHMPFYNKFRAPSIALIIPQLTIPLLAVLGLNELLSGKPDNEARWKKFKQSLIITGGLVAVLIGLYFFFDYAGQNDGAIRDNLSQSMLQQSARGQQPTPEMQQQANDFGRSVVKALQDDRRSLFGGDLIRTIILIALAAGLLAYAIRKNLSTQVVVWTLVALCAFDLLGVDVRYLNSDHYQVAEESADFVPSRADTQIKQDTGYFRVLDQTAGNPFLDSRASYFHNSVGGQHAARLGLYDDLIQRQLVQGNMQAYNMLNTKYFIVSNPQDRQPIAQQNPDALGAAWLVKTIRYVNNADEEMNALTTFNPKDTVLIDKREQSKVPFTPQYDSAASIQLVQNLNDKIIYQFNAASNQFAVFSEIYYPDGWTATIDGKETPIARVNYALRGLAVPAGKHTIEFVFAPKSLAKGEMISLIAGIISILAVIGGFVYLWKQSQKKQTA